MSKAGRILLNLLLIGHTILMPPLPTSAENWSDAGGNLLNLLQRLHTFLLPPFASTESSATGSGPTKAASADAKGDKLLAVGEEAKTTKPAVLWPSHRRSSSVESAASAAVSVSFGSTQRQSFDRFAAPSSVKAAEFNDPFKASVRSKTPESAAPMAKKQCSKVG